MRGFSTLEILIALALAATSIVAAALITFGTPAVLENARLEKRAYDLADELLTREELKARDRFDTVASLATTTDGYYESALSVEVLYEGLAARLTASVAWTDTYGRRKEILLTSLVTDPEAALDEPCSPIVSGDWGQPRVLGTYRLSSDDLLSGTIGRYPISDIALTRDRLLVTVSSTTLASDPTLFLFALNESSERPAFIDAFDNASTSRAGFAGVTIGGGYAYAANGFGSASAATCSTGACAQVFIFNPKKDLRLVGSITLPTTAPPYALSAGNVTTAGKSIAYRKGLVYLGLEKTVSGDEFNIIDVHDPRAPQWLGGVPIGRSVNDISVQGGYAYLATSDPSREFVTVDVHDPANPFIIGSWNAPGSTNFGLGTVVVNRLSRAYLGRAYVGNASEFVLLDTHDPTAPVPTNEDDTGTTLRPESVQGLVIRDFLAAVLSGKRLRLWDIGGSSFEKFAPQVELPGTGTSLACRGNRLYVGSIDSGSTGLLTLITGS